jgi:hypothetical protein
MKGSYPIGHKSLVNKTSVGIGEDEEQEFPGDP